LGSQRYGTEIDMWSVGCVFLEMLTNKSFFSGETVEQQIDIIQDICGSVTEHNFPGVSGLEYYPRLIGQRNLPHKTSRLAQMLSGFETELVSLIEGLLTYDPRRRLTASQALAHPFFSSQPLPYSPSEMPSYKSTHVFDIINREQREIAHQHKTETAAQITEANAARFVQSLAEIRGDTSPKKSDKPKLQSSTVIALKQKKKLAVGPKSKTVTSSTSSSTSLPSSTTSVAPSSSSTSSSSTSQSSDATTEAQQKQTQPTAPLVKANVTSTGVKLVLKRINISTTTASSNNNNNNNTKPALSGVVKKRSPESNSSNNIKKTKNEQPLMHHQPSTTPSSSTTTNSLPAEVGKRRIIVRS